MQAVLDRLADVKASMAASEAAAVALRATLRTGDFGALKRQLEGNKQLQAG